MVSINIRFPLQDDNEKRKLFILNDVTRDALISNLGLLLLTSKGERYYSPNYGTNLLKYIFEPKDSLTISDIEEELRLTVKEFIPQLNIDRISFFENEDDLGNPVGDNELNVLIEFTFNEDVFSEQGTLTLTI